MKIIEEIEKETILKKDLDYFLSAAKELYGLRNYSRLLLGKLAFLAVKKFANGKVRSDYGRAVIEILAESVGVKKPTILQYMWLWKDLKGIKDFSSLPFRDYRKAAASNNPKKMVEIIKKERGEK